MTEQEHDHEIRRYNDKHQLPASCLACQESYVRDSGEIKASLQRLERQGEETTKVVVQIPVLMATLENQAKGKGMLVVIGVIVGIIGSFLSDFLLTKFGGIK